MGKFGAIYISHLHTCFPFEKQWEKKRDEMKEEREENKLDSCDKKLIILMFFTDAISVK